MLGAVLITQWFLFHVSNLFLPIILTVWYLYGKKKKNKGKSNSIKSNSKKKIKTDWAGLHSFFHLKSVHPLGSITVGSLYELKKTTILTDHNSSMLLHSFFVLVSASYEIRVLIFIKQCFSMVDLKLLKDNVFKNRKKWSIMWSLFRSPERKST